MRQGRKKDRKDLAVWIGAAAACTQLGKYCFTALQIGMEKARCSFLFMFSKGISKHGSGCAMDIDDTRIE